MASKVSRHRLRVAKGRPHVAHCFSSGAGAVSCGSCFALLMALGCDARRLGCARSAPFHLGIVASAGAKIFFPSRSRVVQITSESWGIADASLNVSGAWPGSANAPSSRRPTARARFLSKVDAVEHPPCVVLGHRGRLRLRARAPGARHHVLSYGGWWDPKMVGSCIFTLVDGALVRHPLRVRREYGDRADAEPAGRRADPPHAHRVGGVISRGAGGHRNHRALSGCCAGPTRRQPSLVHIRRRSRHGGFGSSPDPPGIQGRGGTTQALAPSPRRESRCAVAPCRSPRCALDVRPRAAPLRRHPALRAAAASARHR